MYQFHWSRGTQIEHYLWVYQLGFWVELEKFLPEGTIQSPWEDAIFPSRDKVGSCAVCGCCLNVSRASLSFIRILQWGDLTLCPWKLCPQRQPCGFPSHCTCLLKASAFHWVAWTTHSSVCGSFLVTECPHDFQRQQSAGGKRRNRVPREEQGDLHL